MSRHYPLWGKKIIFGDEFMAYVYLRLFPHKKESSPQSSNRYQPYL